ncbi:MAG: ATP-binding protein [Rhodospirillales bacterium]
MGTGLGIPTEHKETLFDPFVQGPAAALWGGAGLGLAVARRDAAILGVDMICSSVPGEGSCFSIDLHLPEAFPSGPGSSI